jgi:O-antigen ligase
MEKILFFIVMFFSFVLIISYDQDNIVIYGSTISSFVFCFFFLLKVLKTKKIVIKTTKEENRLILLLVIFMSYTFILGVCFGIENMTIFRVLNDNLIMLTFILLLIEFENLRDSFLLLSRFISYGFILVGIFSILLYVNHIYWIHITFNHHIKTFNANDMLNYFYEIRFQSMFTHKIKFAFYCTIGIFLLNINNVISPKLKVIGQVILFVNIVFTNSYTSLLASCLLLFLCFNFKKYNWFIRYHLKLLSVLIFVISIFYVLSSLSSVRNVDTLGSRQVIWNYAFQFFQQHPLGVIDNWYAYTLGNTFKGAHNVFFDQILDYGTVGGFLFLLIYIFYFYSLYKLDKKTLKLLIPITILFSVDNTLYNEIVSVFWFSFILIKITLSANNSLNVFKLGEKSEQ